MSRARALSGTRIHLICVGGTIAMTPGGDNAGLKLGIDHNDLLDMAAQLRPDLKISSSSPFSKSSASISLADIVSLASAIDEAANTADGIVVTHGTDTLEETAFALLLLLRTRKPVALTGAMRGAGAPGTDGPANLLAALAVSSSQAMHGIGPVVVFDDEIHSPTVVRKIHSSRIHAFSSAPYGPLGEVIEGSVRLLFKPARAWPTIRAGNRPVKVPIFEGGLALEGEIAALLEQSEVDAAVLSLPGGGHVADRSLEALTRLAEKVPVVFSSRTGTGTLRQSYGYSGSEIDLQRRGLIPSGLLDCRRARLMAALLISGGKGRDAIHQIFRIC